MKKNPITNNLLVSFIRDSYKEITKVIWPKRGEVVTKTIIIVVVMIVAAALFGVLDYGLSSLIKYLINLKQ